MAEPAFHRCGSCRHAWRRTPPEPEPSSDLPALRLDHAVNNQKLEDK
jgi:hypothetical protein